MSAGGNYKKDRGGYVLGVSAELRCMRYPNGVTIYRQYYFVMGRHKRIFLYYINDQGYPDYSYTIFFIEHLFNISFWKHSKYETL